MPTTLPRGNVLGLQVLSVSLDPASVAAATVAEQDFTVSGIAATDVLVSISKPTATADLGIIGWRVKAANTISVTFINNHATDAVNAAAETYTLVVARPNLSMGAAAF